MGVLGLAPFVEPVAKESVVDMMEDEVSMQPPALVELLEELHALHGRDVKQVHYFSAI